MARPAAPLPAIAAGPEAEVAALAARLARAQGPLIRALNRLGGGLEAEFERLPPRLRARAERWVHAALTRALRLSRLGRLAPATGPAGPRALVVLAGAAGGLGGPATALAELPVTVTLILHAIACEAEAQGFDTARPAVQAEILRVMAERGPMPSDDGLDLAFLGARLAVTGAAVQALAGTLAPRLAAILARAAGPRAVPVLGAVSGAALNALYLEQYRAVAAVRFGLIRLSARHGAGPVMQAFAAATATAALPRRGSDGAPRGI